ncbi:GntR family transcriptional regulator [Shimia aestuarii]|uniref:Transcriptional regulator, GntR family n=1 Tax=Shimia aestuarii TaxID=254406 RepID=A0A1I4K887_9RHOB|nr:GntR family transcriptional regulator [Shimia aestuarii]SFL74791.1 transcriptional regulator, GntR family [Shimia aestuarii]
MEGSFSSGPKTSYGDENAQRIPVHQQVYQQLREAVLFGELAPGEAVTIQGLIERTGAGMTPIREAIRRLTSEGALEFRGNRRVCVPMPTVEGIDELIFLREMLEPQLAARAAARASEADINALEAIDDGLDDAIAQGDVGAYLRRNYAFHDKLYSIAAAPILTEVAVGLWLRFGPSMRVVCGRMGTQNLPDNHKKALDALRAGDTDATADAIREDVLQGMEQMRAALESSGLDGELIDR